MAGRPRRCGPAAGATEAGSGRHRVAPTGPADIRGRTPQGRGPGCPPRLGLADPPLPCRLPADVRAFAPSRSPIQVPSRQTPTSAPGDSLRGPGGGQARSRGARPTLPATPGPGIAQLRPPAPRLQAAFATPPTAAPGPRSLVRPRGLPGAAQSEPGIPALLLKGRGRGAPAAPEGPFPLQRGRGFDVPAPRSSLAGAPRVLPARGLGFL